jgi:hypothetical protein
MELSDLCAIDEAAELYAPSLSGSGKTRRLRKSPFNDRVLAFLKHQRAVVARGLDISMGALIGGH